MLPISIIIPVYNSEKYVYRCLDSIINQTFKHFECILIDDCSTDGSPEICDNCAKNDERFKAIHNDKNRGSSISRKIGTDLAIGDYILYVDSDDWIESDMLEKMYAKAFDEDLDMVFCDFFRDDSTNSEYVNTYFYSTDNTTILKQILNDKFRYELWNKLVRRTIYQHIKFPYASYGEDMVIMIQVVYYIKKTGYINNALYHYYINPLSLVHKNNWDGDKKRIADRFENGTEIINFLTDKFGEDIRNFEPSLSDYANDIKYPFIWYPKIRNRQKIFELYPYSNKFIFNKTSRIMFLRKMFLYLAYKNIMFPFVVLDILRKIVKPNKETVCI